MAGGHIRAMKTKAVTPVKSLPSTPIGGGNPGFSWDREPAPDSIRGHWIPAFAGMTIWDASVCCYRTV